MQRVEAEARAAAHSRRPDPSGFDQALARIAAQITSAIGEDRTQPLIVVKAGAHIPDAFRASVVRVLQRTGHFGVCIRLRHSREMTYFARQK